MEIVIFEFSDKKREKFTFTANSRARSFRQIDVNFISNRSIESDTKYHKSRFAILFDFHTDIASWVLGSE